MPPEAPDNKPRRSVAVALVLATASLMVLDKNAALDPVRRGVGEVLGPAESAASTAVRPFTAVPQWFQGQSSLRGEVAELTSENRRLRRELAGTELNRSRVRELEGLNAGARKLGTDVVPARVVAMGPAQAYSRTVTLDAGSSSGVRPDQTVINDDGLVGRVLRVTRGTATVLLVIDPQSTVGGRVGRSQEIGFVQGTKPERTDELVLDLMDSQVTPRRGDSVATWGSKGGSPYVADVPIGKVTSLSSSPRETSRQAVIEPYVDFTSLDLVGVVVPAGTEGDRKLIAGEKK